MFPVRFLKQNAAISLAFSWLAIADASPETVRVTTWNLEWFPNGSPTELSAAEQEKRVTAAADVLRPLDPDIILLQEVRDFDACERLATSIKPGVYHVAICSAFKGGRQQVAIMAKEHALAAWAEPWASMDGVDPPRGFAFAWFNIRGLDIGIYCVHLKSNRPNDGDKEAEAIKNIRKREVAMDQLLNHIHAVVGPAMPVIKSVVVGGDFNTNRDEPSFAAEKTLLKVTHAGFVDWTEGLPLDRRVTHPKSGGYPDATFDYLLGKNVTSGTNSISASPASDHFAVTCEFLVPQLGETPPAIGGMVIVTRDTPITIPFGTTTIRTGTRLKVLRREGDQLTVDFLGGTYAVPVSNVTYAPAESSPTPTASRQKSAPVMTSKSLSGSSAKEFAVSVPRPEYPYEARRSKITGSGVCVMTVDTGSDAVTSAEMVQSTGSPILDNAATSAFRRWRFVPGTVSRVRMPITFTMGGASY
jgi:TonB family protein